MTVAELLRRVSSAELTEWMAFSALESFGADAENLGHAITAATVANANRGKDKPPYKVEDFMPHFEKQNQTPDEMLLIAQIYTAALGGEDRRKNG